MALKTAREEQKQLAEAFTPFRVRALRFAATMVWGIISGVALAVLLTYYFMMSEDRPNTNGVLLGLLMGLAAFPFVLAAVLLVWSLLSTSLLRYQAVQAVACAAICGTVALIIATTNPMAARAERERGKAAVAALRASPEAASRNPELERREREYAYGPTPKAAPAPYVPRVEARPANEQYENLPVIYYARRDTGIELTNGSKQQLRIAAGLGSVADPDAAPGPSPAGECAQLLGTGDDSGSRAARYRPGQTKLLRPVPACDRKDAPPVVLLVWDEAGKSTQYRLLIRQ